MVNCKLYIIGLVLVMLAQFSPSYAATHYIPPDLVVEQKEIESRFRANPKSAENSFELAMSYAYTGWIELGWTILKRVPDYDENYADKVIKKYTALIEKEPKEWKHHFKLAFGYYFKDKKDLAEQSFARVIEIEPKQIWAMGLMGLVKGERKEYDEVIKLCEAALEIEPNATAIHFLLAEAYRQKGSYWSFLGESMHVIRLKSAEAKYRPTPFEDVSKE